MCCNDAQTSRKFLRELVVNAGRNFMKKIVKIFTRSLLRERFVNYFRKLFYNNKADVAHCTQHPAQFAITLHSACG